MLISQEGIGLIKAFEGLKLNAYLCPAKVWTIGYGHTKTARSGQRITEQQAEDLLRQDLRTFEDGVNRQARVPLTQSQFDALVSLAFNIGTGALQRSTLLRMLNAGDYSGAANQFLRWNKAGGRELAGLTRRRIAEKALFERDTPQTHRVPLTARQIQSALNTSIKAGLAEDGIVGPLTMAKIREFQQRKGLQVTGIVGPKTEEKLREHI